MAAGMKTIPHAHQSRVKHNFYGLASATAKTRMVILFLVCDPYWSFYNIILSNYHDNALILKDNIYPGFNGRGNWNLLNKHNFFKCSYHESILTTCHTITALNPWTHYAFVRHVNLMDLKARFIARKLV
ncbi:hypothetical protein ACJX0J_040149 [Zea mays]